MVLEVHTFRGMSIDISRLTVGDILIVHMARGKDIKLLPVQHYCSRRWLYAKSTWLPGDKRKVNDLITENQSITALDGFGSIRNGSVDVYLPLQFSLDRPLTCEVDIRWENDAKGRERSRTLGGFDRAGGAVLSVTASTILSS